MLKKFNKWVAGINLIDTLKLGAKGLFALRYGYDTIAASLASGDHWIIASLNTLVIDFMFTLMWLLAASKSKREDVARMRVPAAVGAWAMYLAMLWIAGSFGEGTTLVARVAGALMLAFDTYEIFDGAIRHWLEGLKEARDARKAAALRETVDQRRQRVRDDAWKAGYALVVRTVGYWMILVRSVFRVGRDIGTDVEIMNYHEENARALRKGQAGMAYTGATLAVSDAFALYEEADGFHWQCHACGAKSDKGYKGQGNAQGAWKAHSKTKAAGHEALSPLA